jgi:hypothetical protein
MVALNDLLLNERKVSNEEYSSKAGFSFEDHVSQGAYECVRRYPVSVLPARSTLNYPTVSGLKHQFDVTVIEANTFYVIECKRRGMALIDQIFSFNSKILDYALKKDFAAHFRVKGVFLCTAEANDNIRRFAFAYGISVLDAAMPPIEVMIDKTSERDPIRQELLEIQKILALPQPEAIRNCTDGRELFHRFTICYEKWKGKGYS